MFVNGITQEIDLYTRRNEIALLGAKGDTEALQLKVQSISMNPAMTAFNVQMNELKSRGVFKSRRTSLLIRANQSTTDTF